MKKLFLALIGGGFAAYLFFSCSIGFLTAFELTQTYPLIVTTKQWLHIGLFSFFLTILLTLWTFFIQKSNLFSSHKKQFYFMLFVGYGSPAYFSYYTMLFFYYAFRNGGGITWNELIASSSIEGALGLLFLGATYLIIRSPQKFSWKNFCFNLIGWGFAIFTFLLSTTLIYEAIQNKELLFLIVGSLVFLETLILLYGLYLINYNKKEPSSLYARIIGGLGIGLSIYWFFNSISSFFTDVIAVTLLSLLNSCVVTYWTFLIIKGKKIKKYLLNISLK